MKWRSRPEDHVHTQMNGDTRGTVHPLSSLLLESRCEGADYASTSCQVLLLRLLAAKPDNVISRQTEIPLPVCASRSQSTYPPPPILSSVPRCCTSHLLGEEKGVWRRWRVDVRARRWQRKSMPSAGVSLFFFASRGERRGNIIGR